MTDARTAAAIEHARSHYTAPAILAFGPDEPNAPITLSADLARDVRPGAALVHLLAHAAGSDGWIVVALNPVGEPISARDEAAADRLSYGAQLLGIGLSTAAAVTLTHAYTTTRD